MRERLPIEVMEATLEVQNNKMLLRLGSNLFTQMMFIVVRPTWPKRKTSIHIELKPNKLLIFLKRFLGIYHYYFLITLKQL